MVIKQTLRWAGLAGLVGLAACSTDPLGICFPDPEDRNTEVCPSPEAQQALDLPAVDQ